MNFPLLILFLLSFSTAWAQTTNGPREVTPEMEKSIKVKIEQDVASFKKRQDGDRAVATEFAIDTMRIERYMDEYMKLDYSTAGMRFAMNEAASAYDVILNKYYKKLLLKLKPSDKTALIQAEKAWIVFKDKDLAFRAVLSKEEYTGGGTIQQVKATSFYYNMIKDRAVTLFQFYQSIESN
ncbi:lysozyme inhibitor LprI family protein [Desertivirga brevis]|uniref:lysozyme inhibitor LprI family protein n=1 Tax=Desertivirga brevis TaxID=2810310 RepID=UPI001A965017|nr:lysozyme inhibitor LprI family protein [Pedobacter sp. SYSU D00873]